MQKLHCLCAHFLQVLAVLLAAGPQLSSTSTLHPPVLPLVVRNPYLSTWLPNAREKPWDDWPIFWTGEHVGLGVLASIPEADVVYPLLGRPHDSLSRKSSYNVSYPDYQGATYDASTTNLTYQIPSPNGKHVAKITLSFLSPITPTSTLRQSIPAAYLTVSVEASFDISIYVDVNGEWVSGDRNSEIEWQYLQGWDEAVASGAASSDYNGVKVQGLKSWKIKKRQEALFTERNDRAEWGSLYFTAPPDVNHESGPATGTRQHFARTGFLQNQVDTNFRGILDNEPVFAFSKNFELSNSSASASDVNSVTFTLTHVQDPVGQFAAARGLTWMKPLWMSWFLRDLELIHYHYHDFAKASALAQNYSDQLAVDAYKSGSDSYVDIVAVSARQVMGGTYFTGTADSPLLFLKEISSDGNCQTVDVIFPAAPFFLYTNPRWMAYMLEPLIEHQLSGQYPNKYSMHDLGSSYPNLTGHADGRDEYMPVEECGNMLILALALVNSMRYHKDADAQSLWSTTGTREAVFENKEEQGMFPLLSQPANLQTHDQFGIDDAWGGGAAGEKAARKWAARGYPLWERWTSYLEEFSLEPHNQLSTDDFAGWLPLQTNLALKGIIGIKAMSELADIVDKKSDYKKYKSVANDFISKWLKLSVSRDGLYRKLAYNWWGSWTTLYSLFADALLCFHPSITGSSEQLYKVHGQKPLVSAEPEDFIPHDVYLNQSEFYSLVLQKYGLPLDSRHLYTKSDWEFEAAAVSTPQTRKRILDAVSLWLNETETDAPLTDLYFTDVDANGRKGWFPDIFFKARPVVGGHFSFLALGRACKGGVWETQWFKQE